MRRAGPLIATLLCLAVASAYEEHTGRRLAAAAAPKCAKGEIYTIQNKIIKIDPVNPLKTVHKPDGHLCRSCDRLRCAKGSCKNKVGCTACPAGYILERKGYDPKFVRQGADPNAPKPLDSYFRCAFVKPLGCKAAKNKVGCTSCPSGKFLQRPWWISTEAYKAGFAFLLKCLDPKTDMLCKTFDMTGCTSCNKGYTIGLNDEVDYRGYQFDGVKPCVKIDKNNKGV